MIGLKTRIATTAAQSVLMGSAALGLLLAFDSSHPETPLRSPVFSQALLIALVAAAPVLGVLLLVSTIPDLNRDCRLLRAAVSALANNDDITMDGITHREIARCVDELRATADRLRSEREVLKENAFRDALTGLPNRRPFMDSLVREASAANRNRRPLSLVMADLDYFKRLNDTYGHQAGDRVLKHVAGRFSNLVRQSDMVARFGGEEFAILLPGADLATAMEITHLVRNALRSDLIEVDGQELRLSASFGVAEMLECQLSEPDHLLHHADMALYEAKRQGRDRVVAAGAPEALTVTPDENAPAAPDAPRAAGPSRQPVLCETMLDQDTLALMGCTYSVLQVMPDKHRVVRDMMQQVATVLQCDRVSVLLMDRQHGCLVPAAALGGVDLSRAAAVPAPPDLREWLADIAAWIHTPHVDLRGPALVHVAPGESAGLALYLPVAEYDDVLGVIVATDLSPTLKLNARQKSVLRAICAIGASALRSCEMYARLEQNWIGSIEALCAAVTPRLPSRPDHLERVSGMCLDMARELGRADKTELQLLQLAAHLYDLGKASVPREILEKKGRLRPTELSVVRDHCRVGAAIVRTLPGLERLARIVLHHHEHFDGNGYPDGLSGEAIPLESRIIAVADAYEALICDRPYRRALAPRRAVEIIEDACGTQFDPRVVAAFLKTRTARSIGVNPLRADNHRSAERVAAVA